MLGSPRPGARRRYESGPGPKAISAINIMMTALPATRTRHFLVTALPLSRVLVHSRKSDDDDDVDLRESRALMRFRLP